MSLRYFDPYLLDIVQFKRDKKQKIELFLQEEKHKLIQMEKYAVGKNSRISIKRSISQQKPTFFS